MAARLIRLRYPSTCAQCEVALSAGTKAWWFADSGSGICGGCHGDHPGGTDRSDPVEVAAGIVSPPDRGVAAAGIAGASARREYQRRHDRREKRIDQKWGRLAGVVKFVSDDPQSTTAWAKGSEGERRLAAHLERALGDRAVLLNDRKVPGTRGNIDHLAIASSGVWVIDAKNYAGMVEHRDVGGWFRSDLRIYVGGRDRTTIADGMGWQLDAVRTELAGTAVPVRGAVCFIEAEWKLFAKPFQHDGVWVTWAMKLAEMIDESGALTPAVVTDIADRLASALPPISPKG
jgi:hypothetical protein